MTKNITSQTLSRLPMYFNYLDSLPEERKKGNISATAIAEALPEHTVVPYPNIPKRDYPKNIPLEVYTNEQTAV